MLGAGSEVKGSCNDVSGINILREELLRIKNRVSYIKVKGYALVKYGFIKNPLNLCYFYSLLPSIAIYPVIASKIKHLLLNF